MNRNLGVPYGLNLFECCELVRVALCQHVTPVSRIVALSLRFLKKQSPGIRLIVSFADPTAGHHGGIYQAGNWLYCGTSAKSFEWRVGDRRLNKRAYTGNNFGSSAAQLPDDAVKHIVPGKHRYLMPLDDAMRLQIEPLRKPYPKRAGSADSGTLGIQPGGSGAIPTSALSNNSPEIEHGEEA
jgi:hypothetical protein